MIQNFKITEVHQNARKLSLPKFFLYLYPYFEQAWLKHHVQIWKPLFNV